MLSRADEDMESGRNSGSEFNEECLNFKVCIDESSRS